MFCVKEKSIASFEQIEDKKECIDFDANKTLDKCNETVSLVLK